MRDIISHHYFEVDAEVIFDVCKNKLDTLHNAVTSMLNEMDNPRYKLTNFESGYPR